MLRYPSRSLRAAIRSGFIALNTRAPPLLASQDPESMLQAFRWTTPSLSALLPQPFQRSGCLMKNLVLRPPADAKRAKLHDSRRGTNNNKLMQNLSHHFDKIAAGEIQTPRTQPVGSPQYLSQRPILNAYHRLLLANSGPLFSHFCASVPQIVEELCRIGCKLLDFAKTVTDNQQSKKFTFLEIAGFDGANARTLAELAGGQILTLTNSPSERNKIYFQQSLKHPYSSFHLGHYCDLNADYLTRTSTKPDFHQGFDFVHENNAFQFYGTDRKNQVGHIKQLLKPGGIVLLLEKLLHTNPKEYRRREYIKDTLYKTRYFTQEEIKWKQNNMLAVMQNGQVYLCDLIDALREHFSHHHVIWNSTNFYHVIASDSIDTINHFMSGLLQPHLPYPFNNRIE